VIFQVLDPDSVITYINVFRIRDGTRPSFTVINNFIYKKSHHTTYICAGAVADPETLAEARDHLRPVESSQEDQVEQEESLYAEVHHEDPDTISVVPEEPEVALEATPEAVSQAGIRAAAPLEIVLPPPKPRRLGWIRRGPRRYQLRTMPEENIVPDSACTEF
jgi:hypothetical protein